MDYPPFYRTRRGERFFCRTLPDLIKAIERLNDLLERMVVIEEREDHGNDDADA